MPFGDVLLSKVQLLAKASAHRNEPNSFWHLLRSIAREEILNIAPAKVDSDTAIAVYYSILSSNSKYLPKYFREKLPSNKQERFRVINRNLWSSNAFHPDGLANQPGIKANKCINPDRKGSRVVYQGEKENVG